MTTVKELLHLLGREEESSDAQIQVVSEDCWEVFDTFDITSRLLKLIDDWEVTEADPVERNCMRISVQEPTKGKEK